VALESTHFALIGQEQSGNVSLLQRKSFERKYKLSPVFYPMKNAEDHSALIDILKYLSSFVMLDAEFQPSEAKNSSTVSALIATPSSNRVTLSDELKVEFERNLMTLGGGTFYTQSPA
jgi:hypothetical protein